MPSDLMLHLGCGDAPLPKPWINIDRIMQPGVDRVDNIGILRRFQPRSCIELYCCHALDHFERWDIPRVLKRWHQLLAPGGKLRLSVIDFEAVIKLYEKHRDMELIQSMLVAAQDYPGNVRHKHWDFNSLRQDLLDAGFSDVLPVSPQFDDCSQARIAGIIISLNVVAIP